MRRPLPVLLLLACGEPSVMPHPVEVPIAEFSASPIGTASDPEPTSSVEPTKSESKGVDVKSEPHDGKGDPRKPEGGGVDGIDGAFGAHFGGDAKSCGKTKSVEKSGDRQVLQALDRRRDLGATASPVFTLFKDRVGTIGFRVKALKECKAMRTGLDKRFGAPTATSKGKGSADSAVWKGEVSGVRLAIDGKGCSGLVVSKEFSRSEEWTALEP